MKINLYVSPTMKNDKIEEWIALRSEQSIWTPTFRGRTREEVIKKATAYWRGKIWQQENTEIIEIEI